MIKTQQYVRKPLYVEAVQVTEDNFEAVRDWCQGKITPTNDNVPKKFIKVRVHGPKTIRQTQAFVGDWILYTDLGYKVYTERAFFNNFELVESESNGVHPNQRMLTETEIGEIIS